jgi:hypothetical protein
MSGPQRKGASSTLDAEVVPVRIRSEVLRRLGEVMQRSDEFNGRGLVAGVLAVRKCSVWSGASSPHRTPYSGSITTRARKRIAMDLFTANLPGGNQRYQLLGASSETGRPKQD